MFISVNEMTRRGFTSVRHGLSSAVVRAAEESWVHVLHTVPEEALAITHVERPQKNETPDGYSRKYRDSKTGVGDNKRYFHTRESWMNLECNQKLRVQYQAYDDFLKWSRALHEQLQPVARRLIGEFDALFPEAGFLASFADGDRVPGLVIRSIAYDIIDEFDTDILAGEHYDKSGFTLGLYESAPGLEMKDVSGTYIEMRNREGYSPLMVGMHAHILTNKVLRQTWHRVRQHRAIKPRAAEHNIMRTSFVAFIDKRPEVLLRTPDKIETHTE